MILDFKTTHYKLGNDPSGGVSEMAARYLAVRAKNPKLNNNYLLYHSDIQFGKNTNDTST